MVKYMENERFPFFKYFLVNLMAICYNTILKDINSNINQIMTSGYFKEMRYAHKRKG